jgi:branched-chain amino acid transport system ATP-binding protein
MALEVHGLHKAFGGLVAVREITFEVPDRAVTGLIGPNGSGKTTVLNLITGELVPDRGEILLGGVDDIAGWPPFRVCRARVARTFQLVRVLPTMTVRENVMLGAMFGSAPADPARAAAEADALIARVGLSGAEEMRGTQLTYIDQKRVELARALACRPRLLLLDEWLAGLNPTELQTGIDLVRSIGKEGVAIVMVEHVMEAIRALCESVLVMNAGELIAAGRPDDVLAEPAVMRAYLGAEDDAAA